MNTTTICALISVSLLVVPLTNLSANQQPSVDYPRETENSTPIVVMAFTPVIKLWRWDGVTVKMKGTGNKEGSTISGRISGPTETKGFFEIQKTKFQLRLYS